LLKFLNKRNIYSNTAKVYITARRAFSQMFLSMMDGKSIFATCMGGFGFSVI